MLLILNGASSSGKTALARALQLQWTQPLLHMGIDAALQMLPQPYVGMSPRAREGFEFYNDTDERGPVVRIRVGPLGIKVQECLARSALLFAEADLDLVLDLVILDRASLKPYVRTLRDARCYFIGVHCALPVLEARELARGDRFQNLARAQQAQVHEFRDFYDLEVDTTARGPHELATVIVEFVAKQPAPSGLSRLFPLLLA